MMDNDNELHIKAEYDVETNEYDSVEEDDYDNELRIRVENGEEQDTNKDDGEFEGDNLKTKLEDTSSCADSELEFLPIEPTNCTDSDLEFLPIESPKPSYKRPRNCTTDNNEVHTTSAPQQAAEVDSSSSIKDGKHMVDGNRYVCNLCPLTFKKQIHLLEHSYIHTGKKSFACNICAKVFRFNNTKNQHMRSRHPGTRKRFDCDQCSRTFLKEECLVEHKTLHSGKMPFNCEVCNKPFRKRMNLNEHKKQHFNEKKFICNICNSAFWTGPILKQHMKYHTNYRPYQCTMCPKTFLKNNAFKNHCRVHTGEKPYGCDICNKSFRTNQMLSKHEKIHMGDAAKIYKCEHCDKKYARKDHLKVHMRVQHVKPE